MLANPNFTIGVEEMKLTISFLVHTLMRLSEVPTRLNGNAAKSRYAAAQKEVRDVERNDCECDSAEGALWVEAEIHEEDGKLDEEGSKEVGKLATEIDLEKH